MTIRLFQSLTLVNVEMPDDYFLVFRDQSPAQRAQRFNASHHEADLVSTPCDVMTDSVSFQDCHSVLCNHRNAPSSAKWRAAEATKIITIIE
jgi:hypothetical protein